MPGPVIRSQSSSVVFSDLTVLSRLRPDQELRARNNRNLGIVELYVRPKSKGLKKTFQNVFFGRKEKIERARREIEQAFPTRAGLIARINPRTARDYLQTVSPVPELKTLHQAENQIFLRDFLNYLNTANLPGLAGEVAFQLQALKLKGATDEQACKFLANTMPRLFGEDDPFTEIDPETCKLNVDSRVTLKTWESLGLPLDKEVKLLKGRGIMTQFVDDKAQHAFQKQLAGYSWDDIANSKPPCYKADDVSTALAPVVTDLLIQLLRNASVDAQYKDYKSMVDSGRI